MLLQGRTPPQRLRQLKWLTQQSSRMRLTLNEPPGPDDKLKSLFPSLYVKAVLLVDLLEHRPYLFQRKLLR
jgi:hypothetical protein